MAILGLLIWYRVKIAVIPSWWGAISIIFMPALIGVAVGCSMRWLRQAGSIGLAGLAVMVTVIAGLVGMGMEHWFNINRQLQRLADATYSETVEYAKLVTSISDETKLREVLANNEAAVVGRLAAHKFDGSSKEFRFRRNYIHFHWLATRQILLYGQGGAEKTIWEVTRVMENGFFLDDVIRALVKEPIKDEEVAAFKEFELPFLRKIVDGAITREDFEPPLIETVRSKIDYTLLASRGFNPFTAAFVFVGSIAAFKLVRDSSDEELI
jgi:hypothetical protein